MTDDEIIEYFDHHKLKSASSEIIEYLKNNISLYQKAFNHHLQFSKDLFYEIESLPDWLNRIDNYNLDGKY